MRKHFILSVILIALSAGSSLAIAENQTKVVDAEGSAEITADRTPDEARRLALDRARRSALEEAVGVNVHGSTVIYNADLINDMVITGFGGLIVRQEILFNECGEEEDRLVCNIKIRAEIQVVPQSKDAPYHIKATVSRPGARSDNDIVLFNDGDEVQVRVKLDRKGYLSLFGVDQEGRVSHLFPNRYAPDSLVDAEEEFVFPDDALREKGIRLRAQVLEGKRKSNESIMIIATTRKMTFLEDAGEDPGITDLLSELSSLKREDWEQVTRGYIILK